MQSQIDEIKIAASAAILVGGRSTRFGSDKVFMKFDYVSVSEYIYYNFEQWFSEVLFVSNEEKSIVKNQSLYIDIYAGKGPLGGLLTALKNSNHEYCFVSACDTPFINSELVRYLWRSRNDADVVVPEWNERAEPLAAFYNVRCTGKIEQQIKSGKLSLKSILDKLKISRVNLNGIFSSPELEKIFLNINTPEKFETAKKIWQQANR